MNKIWKWRWVIFIILVIISIFAITISFFNPLLLLIIPVIVPIIIFLFEFMIIPKLKEIEDKEKESEVELRRYEPIEKLIELLKNYESIKNDDRTEIEHMQKIGELLPNLELVGFRFDGRNTLKDINFGIHVTNFPAIHQFYIARLQLGEGRTPAERYYSKRYNRELNDINVLNNFIEYLREILR